MLETEFDDIGGVNGNNVDEGGVVGDLPQAPNFGWTSTSTSASLPSTSKAYHCCKSPQTGLNLLKMQAKVPV